MLFRSGVPIRALAIDTEFLCPMVGMRFVDILFSDGHARSRPNNDGRFLVDARDYSQIRDSFSKILKVLEQGDTEP